MSQSYKDFLKKYKIDDFKTKLQLTGRTKIDFYNDIDKLLRSICTIFDKLSNTQNKVPSLAHIYTFEESSGNPFWESIFDIEGLSALEKIRQSIKGDDLVTDVARVINE